MPEHKYQLSQNQEVDGAATTLINLSIAPQEVGGGDEGDADWETHGMGRHQGGFKMVAGRGHL